MPTNHSRSNSTNPIKPAVYLYSTTFALLNFLVKICQVAYQTKCIGMSEHAGGLTFEIFTKVFSVTYQTKCLGLFELKFYDVLLKFQILKKYLNYMCFATCTIFGMNLFFF